MGGQAPQSALQVMQVSVEPQTPSPQRSPQGPQSAGQSSQLSG